MDSIELKEIRFKRYCVISTCKSVSIRTPFKFLNSQRKMKEILNSYRFLCTSVRNHCFMQPVSRIDNDEQSDVNNGRNGTRTRVRLPAFFRESANDKRGTNRPINWMDAVECNCRPFRFETCGLPHEGKPAL